MSDHAFEFGPNLQPQRDVLLPMSPRLESPNTVATRLRKRERDKRNQQRKRKRERDHVERLETTICQLRAQLGASEMPVSPSYNHSSPDSEKRQLEHEQTAVYDVGTVFADTASEIPASQPDFDYLSVAAFNEATSVTIMPETRNPLSIQNLMNQGNAGGCWSQEMPKIHALLSPSVSSHDPVAIRDATPLNSSDTAPGRSVVTTAPLDDHVTISVNLLGTLLNSAVWQRVPRHHGLSSIQATNFKCKNISTVIHHLRTHQYNITSCPLRPKPVDLIYGGSDNPMTNCIAAETSNALNSPPEEFAMGWLMYVYCMWIVEPSPRRFDALPDYLRPTALQLAESHPLDHDLVLWPTMRDNLIKHGPSMNMSEVYSLLGCTCRLRRSYKTKFIKRSNNGDLEVDGSFEARFKDQRQWGLLDKFWTTYPQLVENMDGSIRLHEQDLLPP